MLFIESNIECNLRFLSPLQIHSLHQHPMPREAETRVDVWLSLTRKRDVISTHQEVGGYRPKQQGNNMCGVHLRINAHIPEFHNFWSGGMKYDEEKTNLRSVRADTHRKIHSFFQSQIRLYRKHSRASMSLKFGLVRAHETDKGENTQKTEPLC